MKPAWSSAFVISSAALWLSGCATGYQSADALESAERGPAACARSCQNLGMRMSAFVLVEHDVSGCVCSPAAPAAPPAPPAPAPPPSPTPPAAAPAPSEPPPPPAEPPTSNASPNDAAGAAAASYVVIVRAREAAHRAQLANADSY
jgi:hypothetical protein